MSLGVIWRSRTVLTAMATAAVVFGCGLEILQILQVDS